MYSFLSCSCMNSRISSLSFLNKEYTFPFFGTNSFFILIAWSQIFYIDILSNCFLPKTLIYLWNFSGTSFLASLSDFAAFFFSSQISHSSATLFTSIVFSFFCFFFFCSAFPSHFFLYLFFFLFLLSGFSLRWPLLFSILLQTSCYLYFSHLPIYFWIVPSQLWYPQDHHLFLPPNYINLSPLPISLIIDIYFHCMFYWSLLVEQTIHISYTHQPFQFLQFELLFFLANSELMTSLVALLSNNTSTIIPSCISILLQVLLQLPHTYYGSNCLL